MNKKLLKLETPQNEWTFEFLKKSWDIINQLGEKNNWSGYELQMEVVNYQQLIEYSSTHGLRQLYNHWSFGKDNLTTEQAYKKGQTGLAYEMIINTNPAVCYLNENNSATMQLLVLAHAGVGHNHFFKNNYLMKQWSRPKSILDYCLYTKTFIEECEEKYGFGLVEETLDFAHKLKYSSIDKYPRNAKQTELQKKEKYKQKINEIQKDISDLYPLTTQFDYINENGVIEENFLYFLEKHSTVALWQKEIFRIVRQLAQYFYPNICTKVMNEGFASFVHYTLMNDLYDAHYISDGQYIEFLASHTNVIDQLPWYSKSYSGLNPYTLGFMMFRDIKRMCTEPTKEDCEYFPDIVNTNWVETINHIVESYIDHTFILQFLSPKVIRDLRLFAVDLNTWSFVDETVDVVDIHSDECYTRLKQKIAEKFKFETHFPIFPISYSYTKKQTIKNVIIDLSILRLDHSISPGEHDQMDSLISGVDTIIPYEILWQQ